MFLVAMASVAGSLDHRHVQDMCADLHSTTDTGGWLTPWLTSIGLHQHLDQAIVWCDTMGACEIQEVEENWEELADYLGLQGSERESLAGACSASTSSAPGQDGLASQSACTERNVDLPQCELQPLRPAINELRTFGPAEAPYEIIERLGEGATATVYRCTRGEEQFAAKVMKLERLRLQPQFDELLRLMHREVSLLWTLQHHKIVQLHDVVEMPLQLIIVMELMDGGPLFDYIVSHPRGRLADEESRHIFVQLVEGLRYIHSKGVVHRDLKPENILIDSASSQPGLPEVKLSDFGHSKLIHDGYTHAQSTVGTRQYWAPEVTDRCSRTYDERVDLWSLGVVLYVMLMGTYPFQGDGPRTSFAFRGSRYVDELVRGLIRVRPSSRMTLDQCLQSPWVESRGPAQISKLPSDHEADRPELRLRLPRAPPDISLLKADLCMYSRKYRAAANICWLEVVVRFSAGTREEAMRQASDELELIITHHVPDFKDDADNGEPLDEETEQARAVELESLQAIYDSEFEVLTKTEWSVRLREDAVFRAQLKPGYPFTEPPSVTVECAHGLLPAGFLDDMSASWHAGDFCICQWAESVRDALATPHEAGVEDRRSRFQNRSVAWAKASLEGIEPGEKREFPTSLSSFERLVLHRLCDRLGWDHLSHDVEVPAQHKKPLRQLVVTRPRKGAPEVKNLDFSVTDFFPPLLPSKSTPDRKFDSNGGGATSAPARTASASFAPARTSTQTSGSARANASRDATSSRSNTVG